MAGCMKVLPGSHLNEIMPHDDDHNEMNMIPRGQGIIETLNTDNAQSMPLQPGELSLHHTNLIHASFANDRDTRRIGLGISYIPTRRFAISAKRQPRRYWCGVRISISILLLNGVFLTLRAKSNTPITMS
jgi:ectoine hydroxylase-related dioxygenase (phytanoyl-CoA dioxygenase family)